VKFEPNYFYQGLIEDLQLEMFVPQGSAGFLNMKICQFIVQIFSCKILESLFEKHFTMCGTTSGHKAPGLRHQLGLRGGVSLGELTETR
jgi:hypothetical protein